MSVKQKLKDTAKLMLNIENSDLILRKKLNIPLNEFKRLRRNDPSQKSSVLYGQEIEITSPFWHLHSLKEIFLEETYKFSSHNPVPVIIDCGANIGLSIAYFKTLFPDSKVIGFEADPHTFRILKNNLHALNLQEVVLHNKAVWKEETTLQFASNGALGGALDINASRNYSDEILTEMPAIRLRDYLTTKIDFLKIDIEGAEWEVLMDCGNSLTNVENLFVEYHSAPGKKQDLTDLLAVLESAGFRLYIKEAWNNLPLPYLHANYKPFWDLQLNIFGYRHQCM